MLMWSCLWPEAPEQFLLLSAYPLTATGPATNSALPAMSRWRRCCRTSDQMNLSSSGPRSAGRGMCTFLASSAGDAPFLRKAVPFLAASNYVQAQSCCTLTLTSKG